MRRSTLVPLLCLPGLFGCAAESHDTDVDPLALEQPAADPNVQTTSFFGEQPKQVQDDLAQLAALEVFEVGNLLARYPVGALNCYGLCPEFEDEVAQANELARERLAALTEIAATAVESDSAADPGVCEQATIDQNLAALHALEVVEVGQLIAVVPQNNPACYNVPCAEDIEVAAQQTCERAATLARIVDGL
jgi:hypothetical protein